MNNKFTRRHFIEGAAVAGVGLASATASRASEQSATANPSSAKPKRPSWPVWDSQEETALRDALNSGQWGRTSGGGQQVMAFEAAFAEKMHARFCLATSSGTTALMTTMGALNIGPGDEVILPAYTFVATFNAITAHYALPIFVDAELATFQIDAGKIEAKMTPATRLLLPVHMGGIVADLDQLQKVASSRSVPMIEDACQAPLAAWRGKPVGTVGTAGCFSFQASKNITSGEGGAIVTNDESFANRCFNFHAPGNLKPGQSLGRAANFRLTEFQAGVLRAQLSRLEAHAATRDSNAAYLTSMLQTMPGIVPARLTEGCTRSAYHLYMLRYEKQHFADLPRAKFLQALGAARISAGTGYKLPLTRQDHVQALAANPHYQRVYGKDRMRAWLADVECPVTERICNEAIWLPHQSLLAPRSEMERIAEAMRNVQKNAAALAKG